MTCVTDSFNRADSQSSAVLSGLSSWVVQSVELLPAVGQTVTFRIPASGFADPASTSCQVQIGGFGGGSAAQVGDFLLASVVYTGAGSHVTPPAGWTAVRDDFGSGTNNCRQESFWKVATSGDLAGMQTFTLPSSSKATVVVGVYFNVAASPIGATVAFASSVDGTAVVTSAPAAAAGNTVVDLLGARSASGAIVSLASSAGGANRGGQSSSGGGTGGFFSYLFDHVAVGLGQADTGQTWVEVGQSGSGTWGISSNQAYVPAGQAGAPIIAALIPSGYVTNYVVQATMAVVQNYPGAQGFPALVFAADSTNRATTAWYQIQNNGSGHGILTCLRAFGGTSARATALGFDIASGDTITVEVFDSPVITADYLGKTFNIYQNGVLKVVHVARQSIDWGATTATTFGQYHGMSAQSNSGLERLDDFSACPFIPTEGWTVGYLPLG